MRLLLRIPGGRNRWSPVAAMLLTIWLFVLFVFQVAPQYVCACPGPYPEVFAICCVPLAWGLWLILRARAATERMAAWTAFTLGFLGACMGASWGT